MSTLIDSLQQMLAESFTPNSPTRELDFECAQQPDGSPPAPECLSTDELKRIQSGNQLDLSADAVDEYTSEMGNRPIPQFMSITIADDRMLTCQQVNSIEPNAFPKADDKWSCIDSKQYADGTLNYLNVNDGLSQADAHVFLEQSKDALRKLGKDAGEVIETSYEEVSRRKANQI